MASSTDAPALSPSSSDERIGDHKSQVAPPGAIEARLNRKLEALKTEMERERRFESLLVSRGILEAHNDRLRVSSTAYPTFTNPVTPILPTSLLGLDIPLASTPTCVRIRRREPTPRPPKSSNASSAASSPLGQSYIPFPTLPPSEMIPVSSPKNGNEPPSPAKTTAWWAIT